MEMNAQSQLDEASAFRSCENCKNRKKKCDKKLPSCSRCLRTHSVCSYGGHSEATQKTAVEKLDTILAQLDRIEGKVESGPAAMPTHSTIEASAERSGTYDLDAVPDFGLSMWLTNPKFVHSTYLNMVFAANTSLMLKEAESSELQVVENYFTSIHRWLPVIHPQTVQRRLSGFHTVETDASMSLLVLTMHLVTCVPQPPNAVPSDQPESSTRKKPKVDPSRTPIYLTCKHQFAVLQSVGELSLKLIQCGFLIALYEYGQGLLEGSYLTLGSCASMASLLGFGKHVSGKLSSSSQSPTMGCSSARTREEQLRMWWGLAILDRHLCAELSTPSTTSLATPVSRGVQDMRGLPSSNPEWTYVPIQHESPDVLLSVICADAQHEAFRMEIRAITLMTHVIEITSRMADEGQLADIDEVIALDDQIQTSLTEMNKTDTILYGGSVTCISSLFLLHSTCLNCALESSTYSQHMAFSVRRIRETFDLMINLSRNLSQSFETSSLDISKFPHIPVCYAAYQAGMEGLGLYKKSIIPPTDLLENRFDEIGRLMHHLSRRWKLAEKYGHTVLLDAADYERARLSAILNSR